MDRKKPFILLPLLVSFLMAQPPGGTVPRPAAAGYSAHAGQDGVEMGASLISHKEIKKIFAADVNQCCLVVEVAFYPPKDNFVKIELDSFMLRESGKEIGIMPSRADVLATRLEVRPPAPQRENKAGVSTTSDIGYERERVDLGNGQTASRGGIVQRQSVGVGIPIGGRPQTPELSAAENRRAIEAELKEKMLPETSAWEPVAGYLYFSVPKKSKGGYELVYRLGEKRIVLPLK